MKNEIRYFLLVHIILKIRIEEKNLLWISFNHIIYDILPSFSIFSIKEVLLAVINFVVEFKKENGEKIW